MEQGEGIGDVFEGGIIGDDVALEAGEEGFAQFGLGVDEEGSRFGRDEDVAAETALGGGDAGRDGIGGGKARDIRGDLAVEIADAISAGEAEFGAGGEIGNAAALLEIEVIAGGDGHGNGRRGAREDRAGFLARIRRKLDGLRYTAGISRNPLRSRPAVTRLPLGNSWPGEKNGIPWRFEPAHLAEAQWTMHGFKAWDRLPKRTRTKRRTRTASRKKRSNFPDSPRRKFRFSLLRVGRIRPSRRQTRKTKRMPVRRMGLRRQRWLRPPLARAGSRRIR